MMRELGAKLQNLATSLIWFTCTFELSDSLVLSLTITVWDLSSGMLFVKEKIVCVVSTPADLHDLEMNIRRVVLPRR